MIPSPQLVMSRAFRSAAEGLLNRHGRYKIVALMAGLISLGACTNSVPGSASSKPLSETTTVLMNPFTLDGDPAPGITVNGELTGECQPSAVDPGNSNARRCFTEQSSKVLDPCFVAPVNISNSALCMSSPVAEATSLTITSDTEAVALPSDESADPWFVELENGTMCGILGGATATLDGMRLNYSCNQQEHLYGSPDRSHPVWKIHYQRDGSRTVAIVRIRKAWY